MYVIAPKCKQLFFHSVKHVVPKMCICTVKTYLKTLKWEVLPHSPYLPKPSDYHLFRSMAHGLAEQHFHSYENVKKLVDSWIASKNVSFFRHGIQMLPERWEKVVASDG